MNKEKVIKKTIEEFFEKMTLGAEPENIKIEDNKVSFEIKIENPEVLIGKKGQVLIDTEHLLAKILLKKTEEKIFVDFDVNQYKKSKIEYLESLAKDFSEEVLLTKKEKALPVMSPFERRVVHLFLEGKEGIIAESEGEEPERRIVIRPM